MVIVTQNQYILASKIHHITLDEVVEFIDIRNTKGVNVSYRDAHYVIHVIYTADDTNSNNQGSNSAFGGKSINNDVKECSVIIRTAVNAHKVFRDLIQQIREQMPDQMYLDKAIERMLAGTDEDAIKKVDVQDSENEVIETREKSSDRKSKAIRSTRKAQRRSQNVLRKPKRRRGSR